MYLFVVVVFSFQKCSHYYPSLILMNQFVQFGFQSFFWFKFLNSPSNTGMSFALVTFSSISITCTNFICYTPPVVFLREANKVCDATCYHSSDKSDFQSCSLSFILFFFPVACHN